MPVALAFSQYQRKIGIAIRPALARARDPYRMAYSSRKSTGSRARNVRTALSVWGSKNFIGDILGATPQAGKHPGSGVPTGSPVIY